MEDMTTTNQEVAQKAKFDTQPVSLVILEDKNYDSGVLSTPNAVIEYDVLVWTDETGLVFEKTGKTSKEKLKETLSFEAPIDTLHHIILDLTAIINGKRYPFLTLSAEDKILDQLKKSADLKSPIKSKPFFRTGRGKSDLEENANTEVKKVSNVYNEDSDGNNLNFALDEKDQLEEETAVKEGDILIYVMEQELVNALVKNTIGKIVVNVDNVVNKIEKLSLKVKIKNKQIELRKKQSLGSLFITEEEVAILETIKKDKLYTDLMNLLKAYEATDVANLSSYRLNIYKSLKGAAENLIALKGKLENFGPIREIGPTRPDGGGDVLTDPEKTLSGGIESDKEATGDAGGEPTPQA